MHIRSLDQDSIKRLNALRILQVVPDAQTEAIATYYQFDTHHLTQTYGPTPLNDFLDIYREICSAVEARQSEGVFPHAQKKPSRIIIQVHDRVCEASFEEFSPVADGNLMLEHLRQHFGLERDQTLDFVRINTPHFEMSFEGDTYTFACSAPLEDEMTLFAQRTSAAPYRSDASIRERIHEILEPTLSKA